MAGPTDALIIATGIFAIMIAIAALLGFIVGSLMPEPDYRPVCYSMDYYYFTERCQLL